MMFSALSGSLVSYYAGSWFWGLLAALVVGVLMSLIMGFFAFQMKTDIVLVGIAINMMGSGGTLFLCKVITNITEGRAMASTTGLITKSLCIPDINIPLINKIPFIGQVLSGHNLLTYLAFLLCLLTSIMLYKTSLGLNIRAVGENPNAASSVGVSVLKIKYIAIGFSGLMSGFGGAFMSMAYAQGWSLDMVAGRGFIALAAQAMGNGECLGGMLSSLVFGFAQALGIKFSAIGPGFQPGFSHTLCGDYNRPCHLCGVQEPEGAEKAQLRRSGEKGLLPGVRKQSRAAACGGAAQYEGKGEMKCLQIKGYPLFWTATRAMTTP